MIDARALKDTNISAAQDGGDDEFKEKMNEVHGDVSEAAKVTDCIAKGYAPRAYGIADFCISKQGTKWHLFHIPRVEGGHPAFLCHEHWLGHAVTEDFDTWTTLGPALSIEPANEFEAGHVWAPYVFDGPDATHMFYTGLTDEPAQTICSATSTDPDLKIWKRCDANPLTPLEGFDWHFLTPNGHVRNARDPHVVRVDDHYLMVYTAMHKNGCPTVGGLISDDLMKWEDIGPVLYRPLNERTRWLPESCNLQQLADGRWALIPSVSPGLSYHISDDPHSFHSSEPHFIDGTDEGDLFAAAPELLVRNDDTGEWLIAFFKLDLRLHLGVLNINTDPWQLRMLTDKAQVADWIS